MNCGAEEVASAPRCVARPVPPSMLEFIDEDREVFRVCTQTQSLTFSLQFDWCGQLFSCVQAIFIIHVEVDVCEHLLGLYGKTKQKTNAVKWHENELPIKKNNVVLLEMN